MIIYLAGIALFFVFPAVVFPVVLFCYYTMEEKRQIVWWSFMMALYLGICGYCFKDPATDPDIVRYIQYLKMYQGKSLWDSFNLVYKNLFAIDIWFHVIAKIGNFQLLPASAVFFYYFILFYVLADYRTRFAVRRSDFALLLFWTMTASQFAFILNSFRSYVAFALFFLGVYREEIQGKRSRWNILCFLCPVFLHTSAILLLLIRGISKLKRKSWIIIGGSILFLREIIAVLADAAKKIHTSNAFLHQMRDTLIRADMYFSWEEGGWADQVKNSGYYSVVKIFCFGIVLFSLWILWKEWNVWRIREEKREGTVFASASFCSFGSIYLLITLQTFAMTAPECFRFVFPALPFLGMLYIEHLREKQTGDAREVVRIFMSGAGACGILINLYNIQTMLPLLSYFKDIVMTGVFNVL